MSLLLGAPQVMFGFPWWSGTDFHTQSVLWGSSPTWIWHLHQSEHVTHSTYAYMIGESQTFYISTGNRLLTPIIKEWVRPHSIFSRDYDWTLRFPIFKCHCFGNLLCILACVCTTIRLQQHTNKHLTLYLPVPMLQPGQYTATCNLQTTKHTHHT